MVLLRNSYLIKLLRNIRALVQWGQRGFEAPSPPFIKRIVLLRNSVPDSTWFETGTYMGDTTQFLARHSRMVYSLEPEPALFSNAKNLFKDRGNVQILNGTSEQILPDLLPKIAGNVSFWLDGHYSSGITFKGAQITPIADELNCIAKNLGHFNRVCVMIDDVRLFDPGQTGNAGYPSLEFLVNWAKDSNLKWHIEHDIFVAKR
jgi:hypothetical protein